MLPGWPLRCNKGAIVHPWVLFRAFHPMNKPGIFKLADLLALQVIALVYQCWTLFITSSSSSRIPVLMSSVREKVCICVRVSVPVRIFANKANTTKQWNDRFIATGKVYTHRYGFTYNLTFMCNMQLFFIFYLWPCCCLSGQKGVPSSSFVDLFLLHFNHGSITCFKTLYDSRPICHNWCLNQIALH